MGRRLRSRLDLLHPDLPDKVEGKQWKQKLAHDTSHTDRKFEEGDEVYVEDFSATAEKWVPGIVCKVTGPLSYHVRLNDGRIIRRHVDSVRPRLSVANEPAVQNSEEISPALQDFSIEPETETREHIGSDPPAESSDEPQASTSGTNPPVTTTIRRSNRTRLPPAYYGHDDNSN